MRNYPPLIIVVVLGRILGIPPNPNNLPPYIVGHVFLFTKSVFNYDLTASLQVICKPGLITNSILDVIHLPQCIVMCNGGTCTWINTCYLPVKAIVIKSISQTSR